jgi:hypothetical protein
VVLYELLTGQLPFHAQKRMLLVQVMQEEPRPLRKLNDSIPKDLETICLKAMAKESGRRYGTALQLAEDLCRWQKGESILARPAGRVERLWRWSKRNPVVAGQRRPAVAQEPGGGSPAIGSYDHPDITYGYIAAEGGARRTIFVNSFYS